MVEDEKDTEEAVLVTCRNPKCGHQFPVAVPKRDPAASTTYLGFSPVCPECGEITTMVVP